MSGTFGSSGGGQRGQQSPLTGWELGDKVIGGSALVLVIALFLPWFTVSASLAGLTASGSVDGTQVHGYLWIVFILVLLILALLVGRSYLGNLSVSLPPTRQLLLGTTGLALLLTLIAFIAKPSVPAGLGVSVGWSYGAILSLLAALAALGAALRLPVAGAGPAPLGGSGPGPRTDA